MDIKKELIWGLGITVIVVILSIYYVLNFQKSFGKAQDKLTTTLQPTVGQNIALTMTEVQKHNQVSDCWFIVENKVYNVTDYLNLHPGGAGRITPYCGQDATQAYVTKAGQGNHSQAAYQDLTQLYIGDLNGQVTRIINPTIIKNLPRRRGGGENENDD